MTWDIIYAVLMAIGCVCRTGTERTALCTVYLVMMLKDTLRVIALRDRKCAWRDGQG